MGKFLIDTNCVSAYLSGNLPKAGIVFMDEIVDSVPNLSIITQIELQCWDTKDKHIMRTITAFLKDSVIINIDQDIVQICTMVRRGRKIKRRMQLLPLLPSRRDLRLSQIMKRILRKFRN